MDGLILGGNQHIQHPISGLKAVGALVNPFPTDLTGLSSQGLLGLAGETLFDPSQYQPDTRTVRDDAAGSVLKIITTVNQAIDSTKDTLTGLVNNPEIDEILGVSFGVNYNHSIADSLLNQFAQKNFTEAPHVELISGQPFNGAYAHENNTIYLSQEFVADHLGNADAIKGVLLEEFGHYLDSLINVQDAAGDEGDIFSILVRGERISGEELSALKIEDDHANILLNGKVLSIEQQWIPGDWRNNTLNGTNSDDQIYGYDGNDYIYGNNGNDLIYGGGNDDKLWGGNQNDKLWGEDGSDELRGDDGNDELRGGGNDDKLWGGGNDDKLWGEDGNDQLIGDSGNDELNGGNNDDKIWGGGNDDKLWGEQGNDQLNGDDGNDILNGYGFSDYEQDTLNGGGNADRFILGDVNNVYYSRKGLSDFARITDFNRYEDVIQLRQLSLDASSSTQAWGYRLVTVGANTEIRLDSNGDTIAVLQGVSGLSLTGQGFAFEGAYELKRTLITGLYRDILGRAPDAAGMQGWTDALGRNFTLPQIRNAFGHSDEARGLITGLYRDILGRVPDPGGMQTWLDALGRDWVLPQIRNAFGHSDEAKRLITGLYRDILGRVPDPGGMQIWLDALGRDSTLAQLRNGFGHSDEAKGLITGLYRDILGRVPDAGGLQIWLDALGRDLTLAQVRSNFINSDEAKGLQQLGKWRGEYFNNRNLSGYSTFVRNDGEIKNDWGNVSPGNGVGNDNFSVRWTGKFDFGSGGDYVFRTVSDDGILMWVDGNLIIDQWNDHGATEYNAIRNLSGQHQVKVEYYENGGGAIAKAWWESTKIPSISGTVQADGWARSFPVNIWRYDKDGKDEQGKRTGGIQTNKETILVIHGWKSSSDAQNIADLEKAASLIYTDKQVLALDWREITNAGLDSTPAPLNTATWIESVAVWARDQLVKLGIKPG